MPKEIFEMQQAAAYFAEQSNWAHPQQMMNQIMNYNLMKQNYQDNSNINSFDTNNSSNIGSKTF